MLTEKILKYRRYIKYPLLGVGSFILLYLCATVLVNFVNALYALSFKLQPKGSPLAFRQILTSLTEAYVSLSITLTFILFLLHPLKFLEGLKLLITSLVPQLYQKIKSAIPIAKGKAVIFLKASPKEKWRLAKKPILITAVVFILFKTLPLLAPPQVIYVSPETDSVDIPLNTPIEITFDKEMNKKLFEKALKINPEVKGSFEWEGGQKLIFKPDENFQRGQTYNIKLSGIVLSKYFIPLLRSLSLSFTTLGNPKVIVASPQTESLEDLSPVTVIFDRQMIPLTTIENQKLEYVPFTIEPEIKGEGRWLGTTAYEFRPSVTYKKGTAYKVTVAKGTKSEDGGELKEDYVWEFVGGIPRIEAFSPSLGYQHTSPNPEIIVTFNQKIDITSFQENLILSDNFGNELPGTAYYNKLDPKTLIFKPYETLKRNASYQVWVLKGTRGVEGPVGTEIDYGWSFTVADTPGIINTTPANGETNSKEMYGLTVMFKTPMSQESLRNVRISPSPDEKPNVYFSTYNNSLIIDTFLARSQKYTVTVPGSATDQHGTPLGKDYTFSFTTAPYDPSIALLPGGYYFAAFNQEITPRIVSTVTNAFKVDYSVYELPKNELLYLYKLQYDYSFRTSVCGNDYNCGNWQKYDTSKLKLINRWSHEIDSDNNVPVNIVTKVTDPNGNNLPPGTYFLDARIQDGSHDNLVMLISQSSLTVKQSPGQILVWSVNQSSGEPVSDMEIEALNMEGKSLVMGKTDANGVFIKDVNLEAETSEGKRSNLLIMGKKGSDTVISSVAWDSGITTSDFGLPGYYYYAPQTGETYKLHLALDNPIYRPDQTVYFRGVVKKDSDGKFEALKPGEVVSISVKDVNNSEIYTTKVPVNSFGSFNGSFPLGSEAALGYYSISASYQKNSFAQSFQVEEYRKPEFLIKIEPSKDSYINGEAVKVNINGSYYFGAPIPNTTVNWKVKRGGFIFTWNKDLGFDFSNDDSYLYRRWSYYGYDGPEMELVTEGEGVTDARGDFMVIVPINIAKYGESQRIQVEASIQDPSNQVIGGSKEFTIHMGEYYIGLKPLNYVNTPNQNAGFEVVTVDKNGNEIGDKDINVSIYKRTWTSIKEKDPEDGQFYWVSKPNDKLVETKKVKTDAYGKAQSSFVPKEGGVYRIVADASDKLGNKIKSASYVWVYGEGFEGMKENNDRISIVTDKKEYFAGEDVSVFAASPYNKPYKSLFTVERGKVIDYFISETGGDAKNLSIKIKDSYTPNVFIGVVVPKGGSTVKDPPEFKMGYAQIMVTDKKNKLTLEIKTDKETYLPGETMKADILVKDLSGKGRKAEMLFAASDKAIWDLSNVTFTDIYTNFYQPKYNSVLTSNLLTISMDRINANTDLGAKGGSGGGGAGGPLFETSRKDFPKSAYWNPNLTTDENGKAHIEVKLPDSLTTWKLFAVSNTDGAGFGESSKEVIVSKDIIIRPFLPRFLSNGDKAKMGAIILNRTDKTFSGTVEVKSENISIKENTVKSIRINEGEQVKIVWDATAVDAKEAKIGFQVKDLENKVRDAIESTLPIASYYTPETVAAAGLIPNIKDEKILIPEDTVSNRGSLKVTLSPSLGASELLSVNYLYDYPYECGEQLTSKLLSFLEIVKVMKDANIENLETINKGKLEEAINKKLQDIYNSQNPDGGWGWWVSEYKTSDTFITAYTYYMLLRAKEYGYDVPENSVKRAENLLLTRLSQANIRNVREPLSNDLQAYVLYVLRDKSKLSGYASNLFNVRFSMSIEGRARLAMALREIPGKRGDAHRLKNEVLSLVKKTATTSHWEERSPSYYLMGSDTGTTATVTKMLIKFNKNNPLIDESIRYIANARKKGYWNTTISTAYVLETISDYIKSRRNANLNETYNISLNDQNKAEGKFEKKDLLKVMVHEITMNDFNKGSENTLRLERRGSGNLYYNLDLKYYLPFTEVKPVEQGFTVIREFIDNNGKILTGGKIKEGEEYWVRLIVASPANRHHVVLEDPLPAGTESINESLKNTVALSPEKPKVKARGEVNPYSNYYFYHKEFRDDRTVLFAEYLPKGVYEVMYKVRSTTPGNYHHPPAQAYEMYAPDILGHSSGGLLEVLPR
ncbi:hypothetical protein A2716_04405 [candidate division WWE3 bacterium RIFCSPHIGHO2_01_FULL_40_23]|uniref:Alpha-2-macroglobulin domain-containing protein n=1 Tax=candidate division WWE3 bacterium RIFCSPLOWO2_01_FULL_41_18 TaxID=1802625 RepID=A0A1F4VCZ1_UNCKA|nr:MAG: hypothetical protein A2716_04405 [candidate division WWE3 bacterium RIFCSPHIGHO2_01_FULL_40_23]OGC55116.1 MAG: hypothetical protein A3A78_04015 [candidate division WWE3 bacterium RIFCSPLOWO2_01_FULL_41_18]